MNLNVINRIILSCLIVFQLSCRYEIVNVIGIDGKEYEIRSYKKTKVAERKRQFLHNNAQTTIKHEYIL